MNSPRPIAVLTGIAAEGDCLRAAVLKLESRAHPLIFYSGANPEQARDGLRRLIGQGISGLMSFGLAGGLSPHLQTGDIVIPARVALPDGRRSSPQPDWHRAVLSAVRRQRPVSAGLLAGSERLVATVAAKQRLHAETGAVAVDMESHVVAEMAAFAGLPYVVIRAVADPSDDAVPSAARAGIGTDGGIRPLAVAARLTVQPWQIGQLRRLARNSRRGMAALRAIAELDPALLLRPPAA